MSSSLFGSRNIDNLNVFKITKQPKCNQWNDCLSIKRIMAAMEYYSALNVHDSNKDNLEIFASFISDVYNTQFLDDFSHLLIEHDSDLHSINETLPICSIKTCSFSHRHHQSKTNQDLADINLRFWAQTMDSCHFHLFHLFECGLRSSVNAQNGSSQYFDAAFARFKSTKFSLNTAMNDANESNLCFLDEMNKYLAFKGVDEKYLMLLNNLINKEEFDSDSVKNDIAMSKANLCKAIKNEKMIKLMEKYIAFIDLQSNTFSVGYRWYYWKKYKAMKQLPTNETLSNNINDHSGYNVEDLFVEQKYKNFKIEILEYSNISMAQYQECINKAKNYLKSAIVKKSRPYKQGYNKLHYEISENALLSIWNLISLILYSDYSAHCSEFSASFRALSPFESLEVTKERNREFWWMSKTLRETVELFGQCRSGDYDGNGNRINTVKGPFYCGVNKVMVLPQFNLRLCAPTSTTMQIEIALKFATSNGTVIQLNNNSYNLVDQLRLFNISWISRFKDEDERLFIGGFWRIKVESIRLTKTKTNFETFFVALFYFDAMVTATSAMSSLKINSNQRGVIKSLIKWRLEQKKDPKMNEYLYQTFEAYTKNKKQIEIDLWNLGQAKESMYNLIVHSLEQDTKPKDENDTVNLLRPELAKIFQNVKTVHIDTASAWGQYPFSLIAFLRLIQSTKWQHITIKAYGGNNWISALWKASESSIKNQFYSASYDIGYDHDEDGSQLVIEKYSML